MGEMGGQGTGGQNKEYGGERDEQRERGRRRELKGSVGEILDKGDKKKHRGTEIECEQEMVEKRSLERVNLKKAKNIEPETKRFLKGLKSNITRP